MPLLVLDTLSQNVLFNLTQNCLVLENFDITVSDPHKFLCYLLVLEDILKSSVLKNVLSLNSVLFCYSSICYGKLSVKLFVLQ